MIEDWVYRHPWLAFFVGFMVLIVGWYIVFLVAFAIASWSIPNPLDVYNFLVTNSPGG